MGSIEMQKLTYRQAFVFIGVVGQNVSTERRGPASVAVTRAFSIKQSGSQQAPPVPQAARTQPSFDEAIQDALAEAQAAASTPVNVQNPHN